MFGSSRRQRPASQHLTSTHTNPSATTAAASAFMSASNQNPNQALSSAAAAAALRARPPTPTNVAEIQTKRTARRSPSVSSHGSAAPSAGRSTPRLERRGSSGSMTERTFRSPSPHRASAAPAVEHPPVPKIPQTHRKSTSSGTANVGMQTFRTASQKMANGHPSWYTQPSGDLSNVRTSDASMLSSRSPPPRPSSITSIPQRSDSRNSVNYSYPTGISSGSPPASPISASAPPWNNLPAETSASMRSSRVTSPSSVSRSTRQEMVYDPNSRRMVPKADVQADVEYRIKEVANRQPKTKRDSGLQRAGSHLAKGTVARVRGTTVDGTKNERPLPRGEQPVLEAQPTQEELNTLQEPTVKAIMTSSRTQDSTKMNQPVQMPIREEVVQDPPQSFQHASPPERLSPLNRIAKKPSTVQEEPEESCQDSQNITHQPQKVLDALDSVPTRQAVFENPQPADSVPPTTDEGRGDQRPSPRFQTPKPPRLDTSEPLEQKAIFAENKPVAGISRENGSIRRSASNSPARQAHFAVLPSDNLAVRHAPLPRSASPIKSALKRSSPTPREVSPSEKSSELAGSRGASPSQGEDSGVPRKKSVRVSFDDRNTTVVGESAQLDETSSPVPLSPQQARRPWYSSIGRSKKKDTALDDDEIMKPRPALPSFGSIRGKKPREFEERPLVRPLEPAYSPATASSPELRPQSPDTIDDPENMDELSVGPSGDHAIGSVLSGEQASRNEANISRFREPLPPVVTSAEAIGYGSDSSRYTTDSDQVELDSTVDNDENDGIASTQATQITEPEASDSLGALTRDNTILESKPSTIAEEPSASINHPYSDIPEISVIQPSPMASEHLRPLSTQPRPHYFDIPGGFPDSESDQSQDRELSKSSSDTEDDASTPTAALFEPAAVIDPVQVKQLPQTTLTTTALVAPADDYVTDESNMSIYSDAFEDLSEPEGGGFTSLDAIVDSPISKQAPTHPSELREDTAEQPSVKKTEDTVVSQLPLMPHSSTLATGGDSWVQAKAFWRSLTAEKRAQLEREAMEDAADEGDREEVALPVRRNSSRRKAAEKKQAVPDSQEQTSIQTPPSAPVRPVDPERVYMIKPGSAATHAPLSPVEKSSQMRTSMRGERPSKVAKEQPQTGMRKTMRSNGGAARPDQSVPGSNKKPAAAAVPTSSRPRQSGVAQSGLQAKTLRTSGGTPAVQVAPPLRRRGSDASDSSFKRSRAIAGEGFGFRKTMRQTSAPQSPAADEGSRRFSLRSQSPADSQVRRGSVMSAGGGPPISMARRTMRANSDSSQDTKQSPLHFSSFGRTAKLPSSKQSKQSKQSSRFGDSSDEDDDKPSRFRTRFDDSSDEEKRPGSSSKAAAPLSKGTLRGSTVSPAAYKRADAVPEEKEESEDLPDSDEETIPSPMQTPQSRMTAARPNAVRSNSSALGTNTLARSGSGRGGIASSATMPVASAKERRGSFMGILRRSRRASQADKIQRLEVTESAARRDTKLERDVGQLQDIRVGQSSSPKLQKRALKRGNSWAQSEKQENGASQRPSTAGNLLSQGSSTAIPQRPDLSGRRSVSLGLPTTTQEGEPDVVEEGSLVGQKKKKKFGALRRMFKLDD